jgi:arabinogalactan endo-1,4-beta-galactosidase
VRVKPLDLHQPHIKENLMKISSAFPSKYLRAADLDDRQVKVAISQITMEEVGTGEEPKPVLYFEGKDKGVVLNKTNASTIAAVYGDDTDDWIGAEIILFGAMVDFQGRSVAAIRCKIPPRKPASKPQISPDPRPVDPIDDEIPF